MTNRDIEIGRWLAYTMIGQLKAGMAIRFNRETMRDMCRMNQSGLDLISYMTDARITEELKAWPFFSEFVLTYDLVRAEWEVYRPKQERVMWKAEGLMGARLR